MRQIFNCKACKHTEAHEYQVLRTESYGPGGMYERRIWGRTNKWGREVTPHNDMPACPTCGGGVGSGNWGSVRNGVCYKCGGSGVNPSRD